MSDINIKQLIILRRLAKGGIGRFDRWRRMTIDDKSVTASNSTSPYSLFIRGAIVSDGEIISITDIGKALLTEIDGEDKS